MRVMAIDYGDARTGIAVSDAMGILAGEAWTVSEPNALKLSDIIIAEVEKRQVEVIVLGYPRNMDGTVGVRAEKCAGFGELIGSKTDIKIVLWDERRTTVDAHRILSENGARGKKRKKTVDAVAATLILEGYLNSIK